MNRDTLTWAATAFGLTVLALLVASLVAQPLLSRAQSDDSAAPPDPQAERNPTAGVNDGSSPSNWEALVAGQADSPSSVPEEPALSEAAYGSPLVIPAADFSSDGSDPDGFYFDFAGGYVNGDGTACLKAPAYLPAGARVTSVYASLYDNATGAVQVKMRRVDIISGSSDVMASFGTEADGTAIQQRGDTSINYPDVLYPQYAYYVTTCLNYADHRLYSVRIYYTGP